MLSVDWAKMVAQGRAKDIGVSWSEEEVRAVYILKIPAEYVRKGILTVEAYQAALSGKKDIVDPYLKLSQKKLVEMARGLGIEATPEASKETLVRLIREKEEMSKKEPGAAEGSGKIEEPAKETAKPKTVKKPAKKPAAKKATKSKK